MRKLVVSEFLSLDGVMEDPGGAEGFEHGGWTRAYWDDAIGRFKYDELFESDALLLGRITYQGFAAAWPSQSDEAGFADRMNGLPKYVATRTLSNLEWNNSHVLSGEVMDEVARLKQQAGQNILINGSGELARSLLRRHLVDELRLLIYPIVLGTGKRLLADAPRTELQLVESRAFANGVLAVTYRSVGEGRP